MSGTRPQCAHSEHIHHFHASYVHSRCNAYIQRTVLYIDVVYVHKVWLLRKGSWRKYEEYFYVVRCGDADVENLEIFISFFIVIAELRAGGISQFNIWIYFSFVLQILVLCYFTITVIIRHLYCTGVGLCIGAVNNWSVCSQNGARGHVSRTLKFRIQRLDLFQSSTNKCVFV